MRESFKFRTLEQALRMDAFAHTFVAAHEANMRKKSDEEQNREFKEAVKAMSKPTTVTGINDPKRMDCAAEDAEFEEV